MLENICDNIYTKLYKDNSITYNSYIIKDEKTALIDTLPDECLEKEEYKKFFEKEKFDYIILNHTMPNMSKIIDKIIKNNPECIVVGTIATLKNLKEISNKTYREIPARDGYRLNLGNSEIEFIITPNLIWPDTMISYIKEKNVLFSSNLFSFYGDDLKKDGEKKFFEDYLSSKKPFVNLAMSKIKDLKIDLILPFLGDNIQDTKYILSEYKERLKKEPEKENKVTIVYSSKYGSNKKLAETALDTLIKMGYEAVIIDADASDIKDTLIHIQESKKVMMGFPTIDRRAPFSIWKIVISMDQSLLRDKEFALFSSYGWSQEATINIIALLKSMKLNVYPKTFLINFTPNEEDILNMKEFTKKFIGD